MPPRKRAESAPKTEEPAAETSTQAPAAEDKPAPPADPKPKRSKPADLPCPVCFPGGWPETSTAVGCEHGSWTRD